jgi:hypothetical protein
VISGVVEMDPSGVDLHKVLIRHVPVRRRWWLIVRRPGCKVCGTPYPCRSRHQAYRSLAAGPVDGVPDGHLTPVDVAVYPPGDPIAGGRGRSRLAPTFIPPGYVDRGGNESWCTGRCP